MKALVLTVALLLVATASAWAVQTACYSWEDGVGIVMGSYGTNFIGGPNVTGAQSGSQGSTVGPYTCPGAYDGVRYLHCAEDPHSGTPQAYLAYVENLQNGDQVTASFYGYDITAGTSPSLRIWAHYALNGDVNSYEGTAIPSTPIPDYTAGTGWDITAWTINFGTDGSPSGNQQAVVIEGRLYSTPSTATDHTDFWIDYVCVTAPDHAKITFPWNPPTAVDKGTWGKIKSLFR